MMNFGETLARRDAQRAAEDAADAPIIAAAQERGQRQPGYADWGNGWSVVRYLVEVNGTTYEVREYQGKGGGSWSVVR